MTCPTCRTRFSHYGRNIMHCGCCGTLRVGGFEIEPGLVGRCREFAALAVLGWNGRIRYGELEKWIDLIASCIGQNNAAAVVPHHARRQSSPVSKE